MYMYATDVQAWHNMCRLLYVDGIHCNPIIIDCVARPTSCMWLMLLPACTHMYIYNTCKDSLFLCMN